MRMNFWWWHLLVFIEEGNFFKIVFEFFNAKIGKGQNSLISRIDAAIL